MNNFTPDPWQVEKSNHFFGEYCVINAANKYYTKEFDSEKEEEEFETAFIKEESANVRLISKAPDMFNLLKQISDKYYLELDLSTTAAIEDLLNSITTTEQ